MDKNIKKILEDLYSLDQSLKKHENELLRLIEELIASKPKIKFDENFKKELYLELLGKLSQLENKKNNFNFMKKLNYAFGALGVLLLILIPTLLKNKQPIANNINVNTPSDFKVQIAKLDRNAFGPLLANNIDPQREAVAGFGGGGGVAIDNPKMAAGSDMIWPAPMAYKYVYVGEDFSVDGLDMAVLKKINGLAAQSEGAQILQNLNFDNINLQSLDNAKLRNFTVYEDKDFGYSVNVDFYEGMISINENWERWPNNIELLERAMKIDDMPADDKLIAMSDKFLQDRNINVTTYGKPLVDNAWRYNYEKYADSGEFMVPDIATVIYPLLIDGQEVYEEGGEIQGLRVSINLRHQRVSGLWNLTSQNYQSSVYDMETDVAKILELASKGGAYYPFPEDGNTELIEVKIGTPHVAYTQIWSFENNVNSQLLVPALVFPVTEIPAQAQYFYKKNVVIPLAKDILGQRMEILMKS